MLVFGSVLVVKCGFIRYHGFISLAAATDIDPSCQGSRYHAYQALKRKNTKAYQSL